MVTNTCPELSNHGTRVRVLLETRLVKRLVHVKSVEVRSPEAGVATRLTPERTPKPLYFSHIVTTGTLNLDRFNVTSAPMYNRSLVAAELDRSNANYESSRERFWP
ncbi:hypothetical protein TNCV_3524201 [Trichonephila clavipes]|uniref:Uncharacterized protein n=1 Tax=Trichonephila clavipes TaxID=2585209 RepID=A0A8X6VGK1_TRICX|nr:hypothetical protein TNCV_3524201 [Trichonephila clavipes]